MNLSESERAAIEAAPTIPSDDEGPTFAEPWQARAFAMTVALHDAGHFTWSEWAEALGARLTAADSERKGEDYYRSWLAALERLSSVRGLADGRELSERRRAWDRAARATPHGAPIVLGAEFADDEPS